MLDERLGVPVPLVDDALGLIIVEVNVVLQRAGVFGPHDLHALSGQALELLELAAVKLESSDSLKLTHEGSGETDQVVAGQWSAGLVHFAALTKTAEVNDEETGVLEQRDDLRLGLGIVA